MKLLKKLMVVFVAILMAMSLTTRVYAAETDTASLEKFNTTVSVSGIKEGNTLNLYRLVSMQLDESNNSISYVLATGLPAEYDTVEELGALKGDSYVFNNDADTKAAADTLAKLIADGTITPLATITQVANSDNIATKSIPAGWYVATVSGTADTKIIYQNMIINAVPVANENNSYSPAEVPSFVVKHTNDDVVKTVGEGEGSKTTNAYSVGDSVPFTIKTSIPNYPNPSKEASFIITDTPVNLTDTLSSVKVTVEGDSGTGTSTGSITGKFTVAAAGKGFTITFEKDYILHHPAAAVTVNYEAVIDASATTIANDGETASNTGSIKFNPNPNETSTVEPDDTTKLYTYGVNVFKYEQDGETKKKLTGASFILYKADGTTVAGAEAEVDANGYVSWKGLAAGTYKLVETQAPAGYKLDSTPIELTISETTANKDDRATADKTETCFLQYDVENVKGATLPATGGIGTTIFHIAGAALVIGAGILLISKKRMNNN